MATIPIFNPTIPFLGMIPGGLRPSLMVRVRGKVHGSGRCSIDFVNTPALNTNQDITFHIGIRAKEKVIVRNHFQYGNWGVEERYGLCRVKKNETFEIVILAELQHYKIAINGHHLGVFRHRLPLNFVQFISVSGDATIEHILLEQDARSAQEQMILSQIVATPAVASMPMHFPSHMQIHVPRPANHNHHHQPHPQTLPPPYYPPSPSAPVN